MSEIGILGGSFDPFHFGHLSIAKAALKECGLSQIVLLPARVQPFKVGREMASSRDRINMARLVAKENQNFLVSDIEAASEEVSYTYRTLRALQDLYPQDRLHFIMGTDSFFTLENWYKGEELLREFSFIVGVRPGYREEETRMKMGELRQKYDAKIKVLHNKVLEVSSTEIKENIRNGQSIRKWVPYTIERYIDEHGLYQTLY